MPHIAHYITKGPSLEQLLEVANHPDGLELTFSTATEFGKYTGQKKFIAKQVLRKGSLFEIEYIIYAQKRQERRFLYYDPDREEGSPIHKGWIEGAIR